ncbi:DUF2304 domain-containing protein [Microbacterium sp. Gd 4-13]|uniref:DUF2304 domain-containing protein n=1 Tax=Microbacterium sp. Gd 4-13 TaxID=2173179 RepID=UPI000D5735FC|nr:DUF2304 domain-containing protein [Microbacterium sp. Gd 4-13]PVW06098.1 DUF2304 domain-containing protein [Microbacterium sp. Gd 4-13]
MIVFAGVALSLIILVIVIRLLILRRIREKYAVLWLILGAVVLVLGIFPGLLEAATVALGVQLPVNLLFATAIAVLLGVSLHLSWELSLSEDESRRLAEEVAILSARVDRLDAGEVPPSREEDPDLRA